MVGETMDLMPHTVYLSNFRVLRQKFNCTNRFSLAMTLYVGFKHHLPKLKFQHFVLKCHWHTLRQDAAI